jgi:hypothetical protein
VASWLFWPSPSAVRSSWTIHGDMSVDDEQNAAHVPHMSPILGHWPGASEVDANAHLDACVE